MPHLKFNYFDAFERQTEYAVKESALLHEICRDFKPADAEQALSAMHELENGADEENHSVYDHIATEFVTPIDREDIVTLAQHLDDVVDYIEDVLLRLYMYNVSYVPRDALEMVMLIENAANALFAAMKDFRNFKKSKTLEQLLIKVNDYEEEADETYLRAIHDLFAEHTDDPIYVMAWQNLFDKMEKCCDACENVATLMGTIITKNS
ncbi:MAG: DUF47 family protein [Coriobacteriales bacterium]|jgi:uncharacterized protein Yka (UPF0111/DUF47 family)|nr:DUF47 family protein [Coriobacteriales bacterium]